VWQFFDEVIEPVLSAGEVSTVVEIGAADGLNTGRLVEWAAGNGAVVHVIDPLPVFDVKAFERDFPGTFLMHVARSLEALPQVERPDAVLIDGDHNWYTVIEELRLLERTRSTWPITILHDIAWPYGRRDMYYDPESVPADSCQPYKRSGMVVGRSRLSPDGHNAELANAVHEGGPRNGVLTAVEDFMEVSERDLELFAVGRNSGLGLLLDRDRLESDLGRVVEQIHDQDCAVRLSPRYASRYFDREARRFAQARYLRERLS
jgi:hypothetical protein